MNVRTMPNVGTVPTAGHNKYLILQGCVLVFLAAVSGCGDFFAAKPTELESRAILNDLSQVKENPNVENPMPEIYTEPPKRIKVKDGVKLFYFTQHHPVATLAGGITSLGFKVSQNPSTNQLIIHCPNDEEADKVLEYLSRVDVPPIQVNIDCLILEQFGDVTTDWETALLIQNFLGEGIALGEKLGDFDDSGALTALDPAFPGAALREIKRADFGLDFGYWIDQGVPGHQVRAVVDMLESRGYLKILMNPTLETVNGKAANIEIKDFAPVIKTVTGKSETEGKVSAYNLTEFKWVGDKLTVTPHVFSDGYIGLTTAITVGSKSKPEGVVQTPILTERSINIAENRIRPGSSLVIGGMRKSENRSVVRGVPFFKDIPLLGVLFSSKDFEEKATEITFILTPTISVGGKPHSEMVEYIREKYAAPKHETGLTELLTDPFGTGIYTDLVIEEAGKADAERKKAQMEKAIALHQAEAEKLKTQQANANAAGADIMTAQADKRIQASTAAAQAAKAQAELEKAKTAQIQADIEKTKAELAAAKADAEKAKADIATAKKAKATADAERAKAQKQKQQAEAEKAAAEKN